MTQGVALIGFGEAAAPFAAGWARHRASLAAYDHRTDRADTAMATRRDFAAAGVRGAASAAEALAGASVIRSLVRADQALPAARAAADALAPGAWWFEMNGVASDPKRAVVAAA